MADTSTATSPSEKVQAIKVSASWTPGADAAAAMGAGLALPFGAHFDGGRILLKVALLADHADLDRTVANATAAKDLQDWLAANGAVHSVSVRSGTASADDARDALADFQSVAAIRAGGGDAKPTGDSDWPTEGADA